MRLSYDSRRSAAACITYTTFGGRNVAVAPAFSALVQASGRRARAAVNATASEPGESHNLSELAGRVLAAEVRRLEERYNAGRPFPPVTSVPPGPGPAEIERIRNGVVRRGRS